MSEGSRECESVGRQIACGSFAKEGSEPRRQFDFIFPNRLARSILLVGSWVHLLH